MPNSAMLVTRYLPDTLKKDLAWGLDARHHEILTYPSGYSPTAVDDRLTQLITSTRSAFALGLITYLPEWAKEEQGVEQGGTRRSTSAHDDAPNNQRRAGRVDHNAGSNGVRAHSEG